MPALPNEADRSADTPSSTQIRNLHQRASGLRDLAYATALLNATERMHGQSDVNALLQRVVAEAVTIIPADGAAIVRFNGIRRTVVDTYLDSGFDRPLLTEDVASVVDDGWLLKPQCIDDLSADSRWLEGPGQVAAPTWRSLLTVTLASPTGKDQLRLSWFSSVPRSLTALGDVADLFARHASLAVHGVAERLHREGLLAG